MTCPYAEGERRRVARSQRSTGKVLNGLNARTRCRAVGGSGTRLRSVPSPNGTGMIPARRVLDLDRRLDVTARVRRAAAVDSR
jgi:hypothetical protein